MYSTINRKYGSIALLATVVTLSASLAFAQVVSAPSSNQVDVTSTPSTNGITPGANGVVFGTINVSGVGGGTYSIASLPIVVSPGSGASTSALSGCQLFSSTGTALTTGSNMINSLSAGSNTFTLDTPIQVNSSTSTFTVKCNVASSAASGTNYQFVAGLPTFAPGLGAMLTASPSVAAGTTMAPLALITLDGTRSGTTGNVTALPVTLTFNGASPGEFTNCNLRNVSNLGTALNTGTNSVSSFPNGASQTITLDTPLSVQSGGIQVLALTCDVSSVTPVGSSVTVALNPASVSATNAANGSVLTPAAGFASNGGTDPTIGTVEISAPGTTTPVPGAPNTGAGGEAPFNLVILGLTALAVLGAGKVFLSRRA